MSAHLSLAADLEATFKAQAQPLLQSYCKECHSTSKPKAGISLGAPRSETDLLNERDVWYRVLDQLESGAMPPKDEAQPTRAERDALAGWIRKELHGTLLARQKTLGRSVIRRLNRNEYANTIFDLVDIRPSVMLHLPADGRVDGYDKIAGALPLSSMAAEGYINMAEDVLNSLLQPRQKAQPQRTLPTKATGGVEDLADLLDEGKKKSPSEGASSFKRLWARASEQSKGHILELEDGTMVSFNTDTTSGPLGKRASDSGQEGFAGVRVTGMHKLRLSVYAYQTDKPLAFGIYAGHTGAYPQIIELVKVLEAPPGKATVLETEIYLRAAETSDIGVADGIRLIPFGLGVPVPKNTLAKNCKGPGLAVQWVDVEEPKIPTKGDVYFRADFKEVLEGGLRNREVLIKAAEATVRRVGMRLFRRDLTPDEILRMKLGFAEQLDRGLQYESALREIFIELLTSPDFLCFVEPPGKLNGFALASRLSYFLWNSTPDEALLAAARSGRLLDTAGLAEQVERLLKDPKAERFVADFTDQWLGLRAIDDTSPDGKLYPEYGKNEMLKRSSVLETRAFFKRMLVENRPVRDFVAPDWGYINEALAVHYGMPAVAGFELRDIKLPPDSLYGGIWTQPAVLKVTANGTYTSPVKRGVWVAERLLGTPIPPPPPNITAVEPDIRGAKTLREQIAMHSEKGSCAACHARFDPYGFALESFDVTGKYRKNYRTLRAEPEKGLPPWTDGLPVDSSGKTPEGGTFGDIRELRAWVAGRPEQLARGVTRHLVTYATGAPVTRVDDEAVSEIVKNAATEGYGLRSLVHALVRSELFQWK